MLGDQKSFLFSYDKPNIIVLVAKSGCSRCTRSLLESLRDFMNASEREFKCDVSVICKQDDIYEAAILKKIIPSRFQYLYDENSNIFKWYKSDGFPAIFVVDTSGKIVLCHHPNPDYSELTDRFFYMTQRYLAPNKNVE